MVISLIGLIALIILSFYVEPREKNISEISLKNIDEWVRLNVEISSIKNTKGICLLTIKDNTGEISAIYYDELDLQPNQDIEIIGKVVNYKGKPEIEINKISQDNSGF